MTTYEHNSDLLPVEAVLPHRPPRLWLSGVMDYQPRVSARGFWVPPKEQFDGHFPGEPILQGVQQLESIAQLGGYAAMYEAPGELGVLFGGAEVKFLSPVFPDEVLELYVELAEQRKRSLFEGVGTASVNGQVTCESTITGRILPKDAYERVLQSAKNR